MTLYWPIRSRMMQAAFAAALSTATTSCIRHPGFVANSGATILLAGEILVSPDSVPAQGASIEVLGGPTSAKVGMLAGSVTGQDGRFAVQLGSSTPIDCTTLRVRVTKIGHVPIESQPGQLRCSSACQWVDLRMRRLSLALEVDLVNLSPTSCDWTDGYLAPKRPV